MSPIGMIVNRLLRSSAKKAGKKMATLAEQNAHIVQTKLAAQKAAQYGNGKAFASELEHDLHDLVTTDKGVAADWLKELIQNSKTPEQLNKVREYLGSDVKTYNLTAGVRAGLKTSISKKLQLMKDQELAQRFITFLRDHGDDLF